MSLTQGSRTRLPAWNFLTILLFAMIMLPGAVIGQHSAESTLVSSDSEKIAATAAANTAIAVPSEDGVDTERKQNSLIPVQEFAADTIVAKVNGKPIRVDDLVRPMRFAVEKDRRFSPEQRQQILQGLVKKRIDSFIEQEIILQALETSLPEERQVLLDEALEAPFQKVVAKIKQDKHSSTDDELNKVLAEEGLSIDLLRQSFLRIQKAHGYLATRGDSAASPGLRQKIVDELRAKAFVITVFDDDKSANDSEAGSTTKATDKSAGSQEPESQTVADSTPATTETQTHQFVPGAKVNSDANITGKPLFAERSVQVIGAVECPGTYEIPPDRPLRFLDVIAAAGGFANNIDDRVILRRPLASGDQAIILLSSNDAGTDSTKNLILRPGDIVVVEENDRPQKPSAVDQKMQDDLNQRVTLSFKNQPFIDVIRKIATDCNVNIVVNTRSIKASAERLERSVNLTVSQVSLRTALDDLCGQVNLKYQPQKEVIVIRGSEVAGSPHEMPVEFLTSVYHVSDLIVKGEDRFSQLVELITTTVAPDRWNASAGEGQIVPNSDTDSLVIRQTAEVHKQIQDLLADLRQLSDSRVTVRQYWVADLVVPIPGSFEATPGDAPAEIPVAQNNRIDRKAQFSPLIELIKATVAADSWDDVGQIHAHQDTLSLVVRQTGTAHDQISDLFNQLRAELYRQVALECLLIHVTSAQHAEILNNRLTFQDTSSRRPWALLTAERFLQLRTDIAGFRGASRSAPKVMLFNNQSCSISLSSDPEITAEFTPHVYPDNLLVRLEHDVCIATTPDQQRRKHSSILRHGQTLLVDVTRDVQTAITEGNESADSIIDGQTAASSHERWLIAMTVRVIVQREMELKRN